MDHKPFEESFSPQGCQEWGTPCHGATLSTTSLAWATMDGKLAKQCIFFELPLYKEFGQKMMALMLKTKGMVHSSGCSGGPGSKLCDWGLHSKISYVIASTEE